MIYNKMFNKKAQNTHGGSKHRMPCGGFKYCALQFIDNCERLPNITHNITESSLSFGSQRRRFYDVLSILETFGICTKTSCDSFIWNGFHHAKERIFKLAQQRGVFDKTKDLNYIIPSNACVSIPKLTEDFILCFLSMETDTLNLKNVANFLSRNNHRDKTTRCKLYQVASILQLLGIIQKSKNQCEFILNNNFFISATNQMKNQQINPSIFEDLLNRPVNDSSILTCRRETFSRERDSS